MDKQRYYVLIETGEIVSELYDDHPISFEILADKDQLIRLNRMFMGLKNGSDASPAPLFNEEKMDKDRDEYQIALKKIYAEIYLLGTEKTKQQMESENMLSNISK